MCIKNLNIYKGVRDNAYTNFFHLLDHLILRPGNVCSAQNIIETAHPSGANIHISKYYSTKWCKEKIQNIFWKISLWNYFVAQA